MGVPRSVSCHNCGEVNDIDTTEGMAQCPKCGSFNVGIYWHVNK